MSNYQNNRASGPKKEKINEWTGIGVIRPRSSDENAPIEYKEFNNGGGVVHVNLKIEEATGKNDENGQPRIERVSVPVDIFTNKNITADMLRNIVSGTRVKIVGRLKLNSYQSSRTGQMVSTLQVVAYVLEILGAPQGQYGQQVAAPVQQAPYSGFGQQYPMPPQYMQAPQYGQQPLYPPQPQYAPQAPAQTAPPVQQAPIPPYYAPAPAPAPMPAQGQQAYQPQAGGYPQGAFVPPTIEDLPE